MRSSWLGLSLLFLVACGTCEEENFVEEVCGVYDIDVDHALRLQLESQEGENPTLHDLLDAGVSLVDSEFAAEEDEKQAWIDKAKRTFPAIGARLTLQPDFGFVFEGTHIEVLPPTGRWEVVETGTIRVFLGDGTDENHFQNMTWQDGDLTVVDEERPFVYHGI